MASALLKEISDDFLTCQICLGTFRKPKILDCVHSFCERCLEEYVKPGEPQVKCPTCQCDTALNQHGVSGLKDNFFILNLVETIGARKKVQHSVDKIPCDSCAGQETVVSRCLTCNDFLCESCVAVHRTLRAFKGHVVVTLDELRSGKYDGETEKTEPTCNIHTGEKMRFYCRTDGVPVCRDCIVLDHPKPEHDVVNLTAVASELRSSSQEMVAGLQLALNSTENAVTAVDKSIVDIQAKGQRAEQLVDEQVSYLVTFIKKLGEQCKAKVLAKCGQEEKQEHAEKERLELMKVRLSSTAEFAETLLSRGTDVEVASAFSQIKQCRDELCTSQEDTLKGSKDTTFSVEDGSRAVLQDNEEWTRLVAISGYTKEGQASARQPKSRRKGKIGMRDSQANQGGTGVKLASDGREATEDCPICMSAITDPKSLPCKDTFCRECIDKALSYKSQCPICKMIVGELKGNQPQGRMMTQIFPLTQIPGYENCGAIEIRYYFPGGTQGPDHPNPGRPYTGTSRRAYLPNNDEGRELIKLLKRAFDNRLVFTIGTSVTTGATDTVVWNDIHHKTNVYGGASGYGYPDPGYLARLREQLAAKGIR